MISLYILRKNCKKKDERWNIFIIFALTKDNIGSTETQPRPNKAIMEMKGKLKMMSEAKSIFYNL